VIVNVPARTVFLCRESGPRFMALATPVGHLSNPVIDAALTGQRRVAATWVRTADDSRVGSL